MMITFFKLVIGYYIGKFIGVYIAKNNLSVFLGIAMTVAVVLSACIVIDRLVGNG
jgi:hypothetical protein